jgi:DNA end-binding protein Ku
LPSVVKAPADRRQEMERALAELTEKELDLKLLDDEYATALRELAEAKREAGRDVIEIEEASEEDDQESADVIDIMAVLKERMGGAERKPARAQGARTPERPAATRAAGGDALAAMSKKELYERAQKLGVPGRSGMSREALIAALRKAG